MKGPFPIFCRGHSGGRLLAEAFIQNGFWMGLSEGKTRDAMEFSQRNPEVQHLVREAFHYPDMTASEKLAVQQRLRDLVGLSRNNCPDPEARVAYGWKRAITTFMVQIFFDAYPQGKAVHLIRDGRDVMLSRLNRRMNGLDTPLNRLVVFGDEKIEEFLGEPLTKRTIKHMRDEIEMQHWVTAVEFGRRGRNYNGRYLEVRYEDLCSHPVETLTAVFEFLGTPFRPEARAWAAANASTQRIGKWKTNQQELENAIKIGEPLLRELGYV